MAVRHLHGHYILLIFLISTLVNCAPDFSINQVVESKSGGKSARKSKGTPYEKETDPYWENHKREFELEFSEEEEEERKGHWERNHAFIMEHNANESETFELEHNELSHLSEDEILGMMGGIMIPEETVDTYPESDDDDWIQLKTAIPEQLDWRNYNGQNYMSPIENQGNCGSCWTYSASCSLESRFAYVNQVKVPVLSKQMLLDCVNDGEQGCVGGFFGWAWNLVARNIPFGNSVLKSGQEYQFSYPYISSKGWPNQECKFMGDHIGAWTNRVENSQWNFKMVKKTSPLALKKALLSGPVSITIWGSDDRRLVYLKDGHILPTYGCENGKERLKNGKPGAYHMLNVIGWGEDRKGKYWLIRNSWGKTWSSGGYGKFQRTDVEGSVGTCGMLTQSGYPNVVKSG